MNLSIRGHVAIITEVLEDKIRIAEQNVIHSRLPSGQQWTRELPMTVSESGYFLHDTFDDTENFRLDDPNRRYRIQSAAANTRKRET